MWDTEFNEQLCVTQPVPLEITTSVDREIPPNVLFVSEGVSEFTDNPTHFGEGVRGGFKKHSLKSLFFFKRGFFFFFFLCFEKTNSKKKT